MEQPFVEQPKLSTWGIEEIEANTCEDNLINRRILTNAKLPYRILEPGIIEVLFNNYDELNEHHAGVFERRKPILKNPKNPWSDYLPFDELPLDFMETAPAWMQRHLNKYRDAQEDGMAPHKLPILPARCKRVRADGSRCWNWSWPAASADGYCKGHSKFGAFNSADQFAQLSDAAKMRLSQLSQPAMEALEDLVINSTVPQVRLKAATEILDRFGIRGGTELTVSGQIDHAVKDPAQEVRERLNSLADRLTPPPALSAPDHSESSSGMIIDAEVIHDDRD